MIKILSEKLKDLVFFFYLPIMINKYDEDWNFVLNHLLDNGYEIEPINEYEAKIGPVVIWIENYPSGFGRPAAGINVNKVAKKWAGCGSIRPSRRTVYRLNKILNQSKNGIKDKGDLVSETLQYINTQK